MQTKILDDLRNSASTVYGTAGHEHQHSAVPRHSAYERACQSLTNDSVSSLSSRELAVRHWNQVPLLYSAEERYRNYPWLYEAAEFRHHRGERVLEIGC